MRVRATAAVFLLLLAAAGLSGCGRKDVPDFPPDAVQRPASAPDRAKNVRYY